MAKMSVTYSGYETLRAPNEDVFTAEDKMRICRAGAAVLLQKLRDWLTANTSDPNAEVRGPACRVAQGQRIPGSGLYHCRAVRQASRQEVYPQNQSSRLSPAEVRTKARAPSAVITACPELFPPRTSATTLNTVPPEHKRPTGWRRPLKTARATYRTPWKKRPRPSCKRRELYETHRF